MEGDILANIVTIRRSRLQSALEPDSLSRIGLASAALSMFEFGCKREMTSSQVRRQQYITSITVRYRRGG